MKSHRGRVVVHARNVRAVDADAGVGAAEGESGLFSKLEAGGIGRRGEGGSHGESRRRNLEVRADHEYLLRSGFH